jgi:hypothetical protein
MTCFSMIGYIAIRAPNSNVRRRYVRSCLGALVERQHGSPPLEALESNMACWKPTISFNDFPS